MRHLDIEDAASFDLGKWVDHRSLHDGLDSSTIAINRYRLAGGQRVPWGLHAHMDQEEIFLILEGTLRFETLDGTIDVGSDAAIRFEPGEFQVVMNPANDHVVYFALGVPKDSDDIRIPRTCPHCSFDQLRIDRDSEAGLTCPNCDGEVDAACSVCGLDEREIRLGTDSTELVDICRNCGDQRTVPH